MKFYQMNFQEIFIHEIQINQAWNQDSVTTRIGVRAEAFGISSTSSSAMDALPKALQAEEAAQGGGSSSSHIYMLLS